MSADNWTICPQCSKTYRSRAAVGKQALNDAYGKVSLEEYQNLQDNFHNVVKEEDDLEETLREDYQQGIRQGTYSVSITLHVQYAVLIMNMNLKKRYCNESSRNFW